MRLLREAVVKPNAGHLLRLRRRARAKRRVSRAHALCCAATRRTTVGHMIVGQFSVPLAPPIRQSATLRVPPTGLGPTNRAKNRKNSNRITLLKITCRLGPLHFASQLASIRVVGFSWPATASRRQLYCESVRVGRMAPVPSSQAGLSRLMLGPLDDRDRVEAAWASFRSANRYGGGRIRGC